MTIVWRLFVVGYFSRLTPTPTDPVGSYRATAREKSGSSSKRIAEPQIPVYHGQM